MLNGIGASTAAGIGGAQRGEAATRAEAVGLRAGQQPGNAVATTVGRIAAKGAPVDGDRVAALRAAIRAGSYRADADAIAGKMIAADLS